MGLKRNVREPIAAATPAGKQGFAETFGVEA
jgi:hypothetical protein